MVSSLALAGVGGVGPELFTLGAELVEEDASFSASELSFLSGAVRRESDSLLAMESLVPGLGARALPKGSK